MSEYVFSESEFQFLENASKGGDVFFDSEKWYAQFAGKFHPPNPEFFPYARMREYWSKDRKKMSECNL